MKKIFILIICIFLCGCYDYRELNDYKIIDYIYIDYDDSYSIKIHEVDNENIDDISLDQFINDKSLLLKNVKYVYLSDKLCRNGINDILNILIRNNNMSNDYTFYIGDSFNNDGNGVNSLTVYKYLLNDNEDIAIFNVDNNMIGYFDGDKLVNYIDDNIYNFLYFKDAINLNDGTNIISISNSKISIDKDIMYIRCNGEIINTDYNINNYNELNEKFKKIITDNINDYIYEIFDNHSNLFGINKDTKIVVDLRLNKNGNILEELK